MSETFLAMLDDYVLKTDLDADSENWYRRIGSVFVGWFGRDDVPSEELTCTLFSKFLHDKQREGRSPHYCRSLRGGLLAVVSEIVDSRKVRTIRLPKLTPISWTPLEVASLVRHVKVLPHYKREHYAGLIQFGYYTGLSRSDLHELERSEFNSDGVLISNRGKTGADVVAWVPPKLLDGLPAKGAIFPRLWSNEQFRKDFKKIVKSADLTGTFKTLRKTSGTEAELLTGKGHEHLANGRKVFEAHYLNRKRVHREPTKLPRIG